CSSLILLIRFFPPLITHIVGNDTDLYRCKIEILFPPPYLRTVGNGTIFYIQGKR
uniref:Immunoglobulin V-set domain-containing protein n=1 Tax=Sinocyclocheilus rhinocerous TaxID=307959 RepID=A0A673NKD7_9TELE